MNWSAVGSSGFLFRFLDILVQLISFVSFSLLYFYILFLVYTAFAIHVRYDAFAMAERAEELGHLIGRPLLGDFPLGVLAI